MLLLLNKMINSDRIFRAPCNFSPRTLQDGSMAQRARHPPGDNMTLYQWCLFWLMSYVLVWQISKYLKGQLGPHVGDAFGPIEALRWWRFWTTGGHLGPLVGVFFGPKELIWGPHWWRFWTKDWGPTLAMFFDQWRLCIIGRCLFVCLSQKMSISTIRAGVKRSRKCGWTVYWPDNPV